MKKTFLVLSVLVSSWTLTYGQETFWKLLLSEKYSEASIEAEKLAQKQSDYLYLAAVCSHLNYDYNRYYQLSEYYMNQVQGNLVSLKKTIETNYDNSNYVSNNFTGIIKQLNPSIQLNTAQSYFSHSLELESTNPIAHNYLAMISIQNEDYDQGIYHSKKAIEFDKTYPEAYNNLAFGLFKTGDTKSAVEFLLLCLKNCPKNTYSTYTNYIQLACEEVVIMVDNSMFGAPGFTKSEDRERLIAALKDYPDNYLSMVEQFLDYSSYKEAEILLNKITPTQKTFNRYYFLRGILGIQSNTSSVVDIAIDKLVANNAFDDALELGNTYFQNQQFDNASLVYFKIVPIARTTEQKMKVHANHGAAQLQLQNYDEAVAIFKKVLDFAPKDDITLTNIGITYALKDDKIKAKEYLELAKKNCQSDHQMEAIETWLAKLRD